VYGIMLAGWASGSKYPLLGSVRASAQMVSYEAALGMSLATVVLVAGTLSTSGIVANQTTIGTWHLVTTGIIPFVIFLIASTAEMNLPPFDLVEAEQELVGGYNTEYSSIRFGLFFLGEFMNPITMSLLLSTLFFGGPNPIACVGDAEDVRFPLSLRLVPSDLSSSSLRPTHGPWLEGTHSGVTWLVHVAGGSTRGRCRRMGSSDHHSRGCNCLARVVLPVTACSAHESP
ncbi:MAG: NADH-quinone oxidoreductase subunit, partial [Actinomycetota bacterium]